MEFWIVWFKNAPPMVLDCEPVTPMFPAQGYFVTKVTMPQRTHEEPAK